MSREEAMPIAALALDELLASRTTEPAAGHP